MSVTWIFFDCFNTLIDDFDETGDETGMRPLGEVAVKHGLFEKPEGFHQAYLTWRSEEWDGTSWHEVSLPDRLRGTIAMGEETGTSPSTILDELLHAFHNTYHDTVRATPGAHDMLAKYGENYRTGLISNFFMAGYPEKALEERGLASSFDFILDSDQIGYKKPGNRIYQEAMDRAGLRRGDAHQVLFIGDNPINDVLKPIELGMQAIHFDRSSDRPNCKPSPPNVTVMHSWEEFSI